jgi:hypothetical protein
LRLAAISISIALGGCSLAFPLDAYDEGTTGAGLSPTAGGSDVGGSGGSDAGGGNAGGGGSAPVCEGGPNAPLSGITSDFDSGVGESLFLVNCAEIVDGEVQTDPAVMSEYCWVATLGVRRLACDAVTVRILEAGNQFGVHRFIYVRQNDGEGAINILQEGNDFGGDLTYADNSFDITADSWWRVSADETTITFSTSDDGVMWNPKGTAAPPFPLDNINIAVGSGMWQAGADPSFDRFDCFNVGPPCGD